jgi:hypothetical protein
MIRALLDAASYAARNPGEAAATITIILAALVLTGWGTLWEVTTP